MKLKVLLLSFFLLLSTSVLANNYMDENRVKHGKWTYWYDNFDVSSEGYYNNNNRVGKWAYWHDNGQVSSEGYYENDDQVGEWTYWHDNGQVKEEINFNNGGESTAWYSSGQLESKGSYYNGSTVVSRQYNKQGKWTYWYEGGQIKSEENYKDAEKYGERLGWNNVHGKWTEWYPNGQIKSERNYKNGENHGMHAEWNQDGQLISETHFRSGYEKGLVNTIKHNRLPLSAALLALILIGIRLRFGPKYMGMWIGIAANALVAEYAIFQEMISIAALTLIAVLMLSIKTYDTRSKLAHYRAFLTMLYIVAGFAFLSVFFMCVLYGLGSLGGGTQACSY